MNGKVYLKGVPYFSDSQVVELTQAEYDALPSSKNSDGILYCIKDNGITVNNRFSPVIYSNDEREIGVWTDGKPLYQKTIHINALPSTTFTEIEYPHNIANIDTICDYFGVVRWSNGGVAPIGARIYFAYYHTGDKLSADPCIQVQCTKENITIAVGQDRSSMSADVTIRYTKTTDTAGSGTWGTDGTPMVHYSSSEHIIGTWVDGKTLYEKTVHINNLPSTAQTATSYPHNIANIDTICGYEAIARWSNGQIVQIPRLALYNISNWNGTAPYSFAVDGITKTDIVLLSGSDRSALNADVTVRYTKTT